MAVSLCLFLSGWHFQTASHSPLWRACSGLSKDSERKTQTRKDTDYNKEGAFAGRESADEKNYLVKDKKQCRATKVYSERVNFPYSLCTTLNFSYYTKLRKESQLLGSASLCLFFSLSQSHLTVLVFILRWHPRSPLFPLHSEKQRTHYSRYTHYTL